MALRLNTLLAPRALALARARFRAWWEGEAFDEAATLATIEQRLSAANQNIPGGADDELFDALPFDSPPRLAALAALWGEGRIRPGDAEAEAEAVKRLALAQDATLAVLGPGHSAPLAAIAAAHEGKVEVFEWREEVIDAVKHGVQHAKLHERVTVARIDLEAHVFTPESFHGLISIDDFAYCGYPPHLAQQIFKCLRPGAPALIDCYVGLGAAELATAFASSFAEPQVRAHGDVLQFFADAGLTLESDEDLTGPFMSYARRGFKELGGRLNDSRLDVSGVRELAWEAEAWRTRLKLMSQRRLERRRFLVRRPEAEPQS
jgi:hypothetical protein